MGSEMCIRDREAVGPHDELYRTCNEYRRMVDLQKLEDEVGGDGND